MNGKNKFNEQEKHLHEVAITAIVVKDGGSAHSAHSGQASLPQAKYLITRRSQTKKKFPGMWTVPGGRVDVSDYAKLPKDTAHHWYNIIEKTLRREVKEEVNLEIENIDYLTSITMIVGDFPTLILSFIADYKSGDIMLQKDELDEYKWVTLSEAKQYQLIDGIYDELVMADEKLRGAAKAEWVCASR